MRIINLLYLIPLICFMQVSAQISLKSGLKHAFTDSLSRYELHEASPLYRQLECFYFERNYQPVYNKAMSIALLNYIKNSEGWGFDLNDYQYSVLDSLSDLRVLEERVQFELLACQSYLLILEDVLNGKLKDESTRGKDIHLQLQKVNLYDALQNLASSKSILSLILAEPQHENYIKLKHTLEKYQSGIVNFRDEEIAFTDTLEVRQRDSSIVAIKHKLLVLGDLKLQRISSSHLFDEALETAIIHFQKRNLLEATGFIDEETLIYINRPLSKLVQELQINLERWRWLPENLGNYYAFVNLPSFELLIVKEDSLLMTQNIVCGKVSRNTPVFSDEMSYIDVNPTWTVPPTILQKDILPAAQRSSGYLAKKNIKVLNVKTGSYISSSEINWAEAKNYKFIQGPGLSNSLGIVKFIFPNDYYIFFHDTPNKNHFHLPSRAYSSGCIRLAEPLELAELFLSYNEFSYNRLELDSIVSSLKTKRILLDEKPKVYIQYLTQEYKDGLFYNYPDVYGYNEELMENFLNN